MLHIVFIYLLLVLFNFPAFASDVDNGDDVIKPATEIALVAALPKEGVKPLDQPALDDTVVQAWAARAAADVMSFGHQNLDQHMAQSEGYFTPKGWENFREALKTSRFEQKVRDNDQEIDAKAKLDPVIMQEGVENGVYRWIVKFPLQLTIKEAGASREVTWQLTLKIERTEAAHNPNAVGIAQWLATPQ
jgi:hypothetical protein